MTNNYYKFIKDLRKQRGLSQAEVAKKISISRSSYISLEKGDNIELSLCQATKLADFFGISLEEIKTGLKPNYTKYKQMILAFLKSANGEKITKTKLAKLVYFADFAWFYNHLESMSGMAYRKIQYGPVPDNYFRVIDEMFEDGSIDIDKKSKEDAFLISQTKTGGKENLSELSTQEKKLIDDIFAKWKDKRTAEIVKFTHEQLPYSICEDNEMIPYGLITQENPDNVY